MCVSNHLRVDSESSRGWGKWGHVRSSRRRVGKWEHVRISAAGGHGCTTVRRGRGLETAGRNE